MNELERKLIRRFIEMGKAWDIDKVAKIIAESNGDIQALAFTAYEAALRGDSNTVRVAAEMLFCQGYKLGRNSKAPLE